MGGCRPRCAAGGVRGARGPAFAADRGGGLRALVRAAGRAGGCACGARRRCRTGAGFSVPAGEPFAGVLRRRGGGQWSALAGLGPAPDGAGRAGPRGRNPSPAARGTGRAGRARCRRRDGPGAGLCPATVGASRERPAGPATAGAGGACTGRLQPGAAHPGAVPADPLAVLRWRGAGTAAMAGTLERGRAAGRDGGAWHALPPRGCGFVRLRGGRRRHGPVAPDAARRSGPAFARRGHRAASAGGPRAGDRYRPPGPTTTGLAAFPGARRPRPR